MDTLGRTTKADVLFISVAYYIPRPILHFLVEHVPSKKYAHVQHNNKLAGEVAEELVAEKSTALLRGHSNKDIMSLLGLFSF